MRSCGSFLLSLLASTAFCLGARAVNPGFSSERYQGIPERNIFGLRPADTETEPPATNSPPPKLYLTGIATVLSNKLALMRAVLPPGPGIPASEKSLMLAEGQRDGGIEVLRINEQSRSVQVNDSGTVMTLTFAKDGLKPPTSATSGAVAGTAATNANPAAINPYLARGMRVLPTRTPRSPASGGTSGAGLGGNLAAPAESGGAQPAPQPAATPVPAEPTNSLTPAEQSFLQQLEQAMSQTNEPAPPLPPPPLPGQPLQLPQGANTQRGQPPFMPQLMPQ